MRRRLPPLNALRTFEAAARHGNFTHAAEELGVAQPAVTRQVNNLEAWLGVDLFIRTGNSVRLTPDGENAAELITSVLDRLDVGLRGLVSRKETDIVVGASFGMTHLWLMPQITAMRGAVKGAAINFVTSERYEDFDDERVDLSVRFGEGHWPGMRADPLFKETVHVIAAPAFLEREPDLDPERLPQSLRPEWLLEHGDPHHYGWMTWQRWFDHHGVPMPGEPQKSDIRSYPTLLDMVRCGEGVALGYVALDGPLADSGEIIRMGPAIERPSLGYFLVSRAEGDRRSAIEELRAYLIRQGRDRLAGAAG
ncbi:MAG: LysR family transcriptional regulator [Pseudomonadota bacterium]